MKVKFALKWHILDESKVYKGKFYKPMLLSLGKSKTLETMSINFGSQMFKGYYKNCTQENKKMSRNMSSKSA